MTRLRLSPPPNDMANGSSQEVTVTSFSRELQEAKLLCQILSDEGVRDRCVWHGNRPEASEAALVDYLLDSVDYPDSTTTRLRHIRSYFKGEHPPTRTRLVLDVAQRFVRFDGPISTVPLNRFAEWRVYCGAIDEEILVATAMAEVLRVRYGKAPVIINHASDFVRDLLLLCLNWRMYLHPSDSDFCRLLTRPLNDAHIHYGELTPAPVLWRALVIQPEGSIEHQTDWVKLCVTRACQVRRRLTLRYFEPTLIESDGHYERVVLPVLQRTITDVSGPPLDIRQFLLCERMLLVYGMLRQLIHAESEALKPSITDAEMRDFWMYVACRVRFMANLGPVLSGFESFSRVLKVTSTQKLDRELTPVIASQLLDSHVCGMDVRVLIGAGSFMDYLNRARGRLKRIIDYYANEDMNNSLNIRVVISFSKGAAWKGLRDFGCRPTGWRADRTIMRKTMAKLAAQEHAWTEESSSRRLRVSLGGLDLVSSEYGYDVGIAAPVYLSVGFLQNPYRSYIESGYEPELQETSSEMCRYFHTGEDTDHPITSSRVLWEALQWFDLRARDRVAHISFLDVTPYDYRVTETVGERLDNLVWLYDLMTRNTDGVHSKELPGIRSEIDRLSCDAFVGLRNRPRIVDLIDAWNLRPLDEDSSRFAGVHVAAQLAYIAFTGLEDLNVEWVSRLAIELVRPSDSIPGWVDDTRKSLGTFRQAEYRSEWLELARHMIFQEIERRGVGIETCPTSNWIIASGLQQPPAGVSFSIGRLLPNLVLGTDDPRMFRTDFPAEVAILASHMLMKEVPRREVCDRLRRIIVVNDNS